MKWAYRIFIAVALACGGWMMYWAFAVATAPWQIVLYAGVGLLDLTIAVIHIRNLRRLNGRDRTSQANCENSQASGGSGNVGIAIASAFAAANGAATRIGASPIAMEAQEEPIRAWRGVRLICDDSTVYLRSMNDAFGHLTATEMHASCFYAQQYYPGNKPRDHQSPDLGCSCGFYGVKEKTDIMGDILAEVDFYGTVIEHETGYRAEYQRILSLRLPRGVCYGSFMCDGQPEIVVFPPGAPVKVVCAACAPQYDKTATLGQIGARLGLEVRWDE